MFKNNTQAQGATQVKPSFSAPQLFLATSIYIAGCSAVVAAFIFSFNVQVDPASSAVVVIAAFTAPYLAGLILLMGALPLLLAAVGRPLGSDRKGGIAKGFQAAAVLALTAGALIILSGLLFDLPMVLYVAVFGIALILVLGDFVVTAWRRN